MTSRFLLAAGRAVFLTCGGYYIRETSQAPASSSTRHVQQNSMNNPARIENLIKTIAGRASIAELESNCKGLDLNEVGIRGRTPLMVAAAEGLLAAVEVLIRNGASVHGTGLGKMTALHEASAHGQTSVAKYLLSVGAEVDPETSDGSTPLMCAAAWGNLEVIRLLLDHGADSSKTDHTAATAAEIAYEKSEDKAAKLINTYSKPPN